MVPVAVVGVVAVAVIIVVVLVVILGGFNWGTAIQKPLFELPGTSIPGFLMLIFVIMAKFTADLRRSKILSGRRVK